jgi:hypothetical protein
MGIDKHMPRIRVLGILSYFSLLLWVPMLFASFMAFDAPGSENKLAVWAFVIVVWCLPVALLSTPKLSRRLRVNGFVKSSYCLVGIPLALVVAPLVLGILQVIYALFRF